MDDSRVAGWLLNLVNRSHEKRGGCVDNTPIMKTDVGQGIGTVFALLMLSYLILPLIGVCVFIAFDIGDMAKGIDPFWIWSCRAFTGALIWGIFSIVKAIFGKKSNKVKVYPIVRDYTPNKRVTANDFSSTWGIQKPSGSA